MEEDELNGRVDQQEVATTFELHLLSLLFVACRPTVVVVFCNMSEPAEDDGRAVNPARKAPPSLLRTLLGKGQSAKDALTHDGNNASIILNDKTSRETPWTPKSLGRAKTAIIYKVGLAPLSALKRM